MDMDRSSTMRGQSPNFRGRTIRGGEDSSIAATSHGHSPMSIRKQGSIGKLSKLMADREAAKEAGRKKEKNLTMEIKNYQRKTMLNGIDQQESLDENFDLVK